MCDKYQQDSFKREIETEGKKERTKTKLRTSKSHRKKQKQFSPIKFPKIATLPIYKLLSNLTLFSSNDASFYQLTLNS